MSEKKESETVWYEALLAKYPLVFKEISYLECDVGWSKLIDSTASVIEYQIRNYVPEDIRDDIFATQVKQKFGGLRFYMSHETPYISGAIALAEELSNTTCEKCGCPGIKRNLKGWITTLCDTDFQKANFKLG